MPKYFTDKEERMYEHVKGKVGGSRAEEIAARTVNKYRKKKGHTKKSVDDNDLFNHCFSEVVDEVEKGFGIDVEETNDWALSANGPELFPIRIEKSATAIQYSRGKDWSDHFRFTPLEKKAIEIAIEEIDHAGKQESLYQKKNPSREDGEALGRIRQGIDRRKRSLEKKLLEHQLKESQSNGLYRGEVAGKSLEDDDMEKARADEGKSAEEKVSARKTRNVRLPTKGPNQPKGPKGVHVSGGGKPGESRLRTQQGIRSESGSDSMPKTRAALKQSPFAKMNIRSRQREQAKIKPNLPKSLGDEEVNMEKSFDQFFTEDELQKSEGMRMSEQNSGGESSNTSAKTGQAPRSAVGPKKVEYDPYQSKQTQEGGTQKGSADYPIGNEGSNAGAGKGKEGGFVTHQSVTPKEVQYNPHQSPNVVEKSEVSLPFIREGRSLNLLETRHGSDYEVAKRIEKGTTTPQPSRNALLEGEHNRNQQDEQG